MQSEPVPASDSEIKIGGEFGMDVALPFGIGPRQVSSLAVALQARRTGRGLAFNSAPPKVFVRRELPPNSPRPPGRL
jgi:hypothetical protein